MIKKYWNSFSSLIRRDQLLNGSLVVFSGSMVASAINYLYHMILGRMLGPADYGIFSSLVSLSYIYGIPVGVLNIVSLKYISSLREGEGVEAAAGFFYWFGKRIIWFSVFLFFLSLVTVPFVTNFLRLSSFIWVIIANTITIIGVYGGFCSSVLQGFLRFGLNSIASILSSFLKIILAIVFIYLGWRVTGVLFSLFLTSLVSLFLVIYFIKKKMNFPNDKIKKVTIPLPEMLKFAFPVLLSLLALTSFYTTDILLVKNLFSEKEAGLYASLALLGKIVFFASSSINLVMFPLVSGKKAKGENYRKIFLISLLIVFSVSLCLIFIYFLFPNLMINLLFGSQYLAIAPELGLFAIFMAFYSLVSLTVNFFLAVAKTTMIVLPLLGAVLQIGLILLFHGSIRQVVLINIFVSGLLLVSLLLPFLFSWEISKDKVE